MNISRLLYFKEFLVFFLSYLQFNELVVIFIPFPKNQFEIIDSISGLVVVVLVLFCFVLLSAFTLIYKTGLWLYPPLGLSVNIKMFKHLLDPQEITVIILCYFDSTLF